MHNRVRVAGVFLDDTGPAAERDERVPQVMRDAGGHLAEDGELLRSDQLILGVAKVEQRLLELALVRLHLLVELRVLNGDAGVLGKQ